MKNIKYLLLIIFISFIGCEDEGDPVLYNTMPKQNGQQPVITSVSPTAAFAGDEIVTIIGQNFLHGSDTTKVYFGSVRVKILSIANDKIEVYAPVVPKQEADIPNLTYADTAVLVRISVPYTSLFNDDYNYSLINGITKFGNVDANASLSPQALAVDNSGNILASYLEGENQTGAGVKKIGSDGTFYPTFSTKHTGTYTSMKIGPGDTLYTVSPAVWYIPTYPKEGGAYGAIIFKNNKMKITDFDFDALKHLWVGGTGAVDSIFRVTRSPLAFKSYGFTGAVRSVRFFAGALYIAANVNGEEKIFKAVINSSNDMEAPTEYFNLSANANNLKPNSMTFDVDGNLYIASDALNGILEIKPNKSVVYRYSSYFSIPFKSIQWGTGNYLYATVQTFTTKGSVVKIDMRTSGAPYYGRQ
jgi:hypothetical protein